MDSGTCGFEKVWTQGSVDDETMRTLGCVDPETYGPRDVWDSGTCGLGDVWTTRRCGIWDVWTWGQCAECRILRGQPWMIFLVNISVVIHSRLCLILAKFDANIYLR